MRTRRFTAACAALIVTAGLAAPETAAATELPSWGIGTSSLGMNVPLEAGLSVSGTIGVAAFNAGGTPDLLAVEALQSPSGGLVPPAPSDGVQSPFIASVTGAYVPAGGTEQVPFTVSVPEGTPPGQYLTYLVLVNPPAPCPSGVSVCMSQQTQVAYPIEVVVLNADGSAPGPFSEAPGAITGFRDRNWGGGWYSAYPVQTETNTSVQNVFGWATIEDTVTSLTTGQTWTWGPSVLYAVLPGRTVDGIPGSYTGQVPFPSGQFVATACLWANPEVPWGSNHPVDTSGTPTCVTSDVTN